MIVSKLKENELSQIHRNTEFIYREYAVMQPLQRSYGITEERIQNLESKDRKNELASVITFLRNHETNEKYMSPEAFEPVITEIMGPLSLTKKDIGFIMDGLSMMDKEAEIQHDKKGNILYDSDTKDLEDVCIEERIDDYMEREVLPHVPDAKAFFEEDLSKKKPVIKTGAEIPFTRYFYKYQQPEPSEKVAELIEKLETEINQQMQELFKK